MNRPKKQRGFTLVELIIVIAILAILTVAAIPIYNGVRESAEKATAQSDATLLANTLNNYNAMRPTGTPPITEASTVTGLYASSGGDLLVLQYGDASQVLQVQISAARFAQAMLNINCDSGFWQLNDEIKIN